MSKLNKSVSALLVASALYPAADAIASNNGEVAAVVAADGQTSNLSGIVSDEMGPVMGASVIIKGTTNGTITDLDGNFTLNDVRKGEVIVISFIGYASQEVVFNGQSSLRVALKEDTQKLDEVVVVGYGTQKKVNLTGAIAMTDGDIMENRAIGGTAQGLQGVIPNLNIDFNSGKPDATTQFNVRGNTSLNGGGALILVDGVETEDISLINPQDIASVSVLKDAASASIYGARAAFGVVLITTKKGGKNQKVKVNYNNNFSWSTPSHLPESANSLDWANAVNQANINQGGGAVFNNKFMSALEAHHNDPINNPGILVDREGIQNSAHTATNPGWAYVSNTDWFDEFYTTAFMQQHNASISGGSEKNAYYGSVGYKDQNGLFQHGTDKYKRINMSFNFETSVTDWLDLRFATKYNRSETDEPSSGVYADMGSFYHEVYRMFPTVPMYLENGDYAGMEGNGFNKNVAGRMAQGGRTTNNRDDFWYTGAITIRPMKGLVVKADYTGNKFFRSYKQHAKTIYQTMPEGAPSLTVVNPNGVSQTKFNNTYQAFNAWAEYEKSIKDHNMKLMMGYNQESKELTDFGGTSTNLFINNIPVSDLAANFKNISEGGTIWAVQGAFFRANYDYMGKYLLEVNGRYDGSSKYMEGNRWGFFPSASAGWRLSEEKFFEPARNVFDNVKLRASTGLLGNQVTDGNFQYIGSLGSANLNYVMDGKPVTGLTPATLASTNITWEKVLTNNFGLDLGVLNNRLTASFDYYVRYTQGMVRNKTYPGVIGTTGGKENVADMRTNGWELSLQWQDQIASVLGKPMKYSVSLGLSDAFSKITKYDNPTGALSDFYKGKNMGEIWGYVTDGFIMTEEEAKQMATIQGVISKTWLPGDIRYADLNGDGVIDYGNNTLSNSGDKKVIGNTTPRYRFNIQGSASWRNFDLRVLFEGVAKRDLWMGSSVFWGYTDNVWQQNINQYHIENSWSEENPNAFYPRPLWGTRSKQIQTKYLMNGAYIRLKDITLSYTIPKSVLSKLKIEQVRVFASGANLWEASGLPPFLNPEQTGTNVDGSNNEGKVYPFSRSYSCGVNLTF